MPNSFLEIALAREAERADDFGGLMDLARNASWFNPACRNAMLEWYSEVAKVYGLCPITLENAVYFFDCFLASNMEQGRRLTAVDFPAIGMVALLVSSKMYGTESPLKIADLVGLAPQLRISPRDICVLELHFIQEINFTLFVTTTTEFARSMIERLEATTAGADLVSLLGLYPGESILLDNIYAWACKYISYLERKFENLEFRQSEKAFAVANCAVARWSIMHLSFSSNTEEAEAMANCLRVLQTSRPYTPELFDPIIREVHLAWHGMLATVAELSVDPYLRRELEEQIVNCIAEDTCGGGTYPTLPVERRPVQRAVVSASGSPGDLPNQRSKISGKMKIIHCTAKRFSPSRISPASSSCPAPNSLATAFSVLGKRKHVRTDGADYQNLPPDQEVEDLSSKPISVTLETAKTFSSLENSEDVPKCPNTSPVDITTDLDSGGTGESGESQTEATRTLVYASDGEVSEGGALGAKAKP